MALRPIRIGVIGIGQVTERFVKATRLFPELVITAVADVLPLAEARDRLIELGLSPDLYFRVEGDSNLPAEFWTRMDLVYDASPNCYRRAYFRAAIEHGKHALLEKPPGSSVKDAEEILKRAREHEELCFMCSSHYLFYETFQILLSLLHSGKLRPLGRIHRIEGRILEDDNLSHPRYQWLLDPAKSGGGVGVDTGLHLIARCYALGAEEIKVVRAEGDTCLEGPKVRIDGQSRIPETYLAVVAELQGDIFAPGARAFLQVGKGIPKLFADKSFAVLFEHGRVYLNHTRLEIWLSGRLWKRFTATSEPYTDILAAFLSLLTDGTDSDRTLEIAVRSLERVFDAYERLERVFFYPEIEAAIAHLVSPEARVAQQIRARG